MKSRGWFAKFDRLFTDEFDRLLREFDQLFDETSHPPAPAPASAPGDTVEAETHTTEVRPDGTRIVTRTVTRTTRAVKPEPTR